jgi:hypothetical protein
MKIDIEKAVIYTYIASMFVKNAKETKVIVPTPFE